ncbi:unnamed protein product [Microthlaspi erraticum]|uniref:Uncharacterized protein n=1 Tax=Microthlaspi erraticum TaxID=1685480 RepID=A0A6D2KU58_9BRAS|nr:unnamed protein product [Microthlaspi erraticum]CAA7055877.1 unnamed protein product [Microthlaspi erraticum]
MTNTRRSHASYNSQDRVTDDISDGRDHKIWDCESPLYDACELVSFAHIIERKLLPFTPHTRPAGLSLRALMDKDKDDYSTANETTTRSGRRHWWSRKKNEETHEEDKTNKTFGSIFWWNSWYKKLFV